MKTKPLIADIDAEIAKLRGARSVLLGLRTTSKSPARTAKPGTKKAKRTMSAEGKARIATAQKKRWAAAKKRAKAAAAVELRYPRP